MKVEIYSDLICPWCFIGKRRFEKAVAQLDSRNIIQVIWRPFELNPNMPVEGVERSEYRKKKFGSLEYSKKLDEQVGTAGAAEGIAFNYELMKKTPNTVKGHLLVEYALTEGKQDAIVEALFEAYFTKGLDIGAVDVLAKTGADVGLDPARVREFISSPDAAAQLKQEEQVGLGMGINGVPAFVIDGKLAFTGAQDPNVIVQRLGV